MFPPKNELFFVQKLCPPVFCDDNCAFQQNSKMFFFVNNFCMSELQKLKFLTQKEAIAKQISAALRSPTVHSGKSAFQKITVFMFQQFVPTYNVNLRSLKNNLQVSVFQGQDFAFMVDINMFHREITAKRVTFISFLS